MKIKTKYKSVLLLSLFLTACLSPLTSFGRATASPRTSAPTFSWEEVSYVYNFTRVWDGESNIVNFSNSYAETYTTSEHYWNESADTWTRKIHTIYYQANYSFYSNKTFVGNVTVGMDLDVYRVNIQLEDAVDMIWVALKKGVVDSEYYLDSQTSDDYLFEEYYQDVVSECTKFSLPDWEVLDEWTEISNKSGTINQTNYSPPPEYGQYFKRREIFTQPLILTSQIFTTENGDKIAWAEMFYNYFIYNDSDHNGIYSVGKMEGQSIAGGMSLYSSDEWCGVMNPIAEDKTIYFEQTYPEDPGSNYNYTTHWVLPNDTSVSEIAATIEFTPPTLDENNIINWDIVYPQYPIYVSINNQGDTYSPPGFNYASLSPADFSYGYAYNLTSNQANLDYTFEMSKITEPGFYDAIQGLGLSIPRYNFFISSFDVNEINQVDITVPSGLFAFESNETTIAEINMMNPVKKNYTLYDYPMNGINTEMESPGGSLHKMAMMQQEMSTEEANPVSNLIFAIRKLVDADPTFTNMDDLYHVETQNYPLWNGDRLVHDPTLTIYYALQDITWPEQPGPPGPGAIPGFNLYAVLTIVAVIVPMLVIKRKKKIKF